MFGFLRITNSMQKIIYIFLIFILGCNSNVPLARMDSKNPIEFIDEHLGEKIGRGVCFDLVREIMELKNPHWYKKEWCNKSEMKKHISEFPQSGDIIWMKYVQMKDGSKTKNHIAIVYSVNSNGTITIAEQNNCADSDAKRIRYYGKKALRCNDSKVELYTFNPSDKVKGKIVYYRF